MTKDERQDLLVRLDDELLLGGVILPEWCTFIVREADTAFARGAHLASILTAVAGIETYLRGEAAADQRSTLSALIDTADVDESLRSDLHTLRRFRNRWVHVNDPWEDSELIEQPERFERQLEDMALFAARTLRRTIYSSPWV